MHATDWDSRIVRRWPDVPPRARRTLANLLASASPTRLRRAVVVLSRSEPRRPIVFDDYTLSRSELRRLRADPDFAAAVSGTAIKRFL